MTHISETYKLPDAGDIPVITWTHNSSVIKAHTSAAFQQILSMRADSGSFGLVGGLGSSDVGIDDHASSFRYLWKLLQE